jgi:beta-N-acetylhexosaminidase
MKRPGRLLVLGFEGTSVPDWLLALAERYGLGGLILFRRNCADASTVLKLLAEAKRRLEEVDPGWAHPVFVDQEGGRVERLQDGVPHLPPAREFARQGEEGVEGAVRLQACALASLGFAVNLAPVCDVLQEGESGDIGDRSFGADPIEAGRIAAAYIRGSLGGGILPCAKHFPGLGAARLNTHKELAVVEKSRELWAAHDAEPFRAAVEHGVPLVMAAHVVYPSVSRSPATLSPEWLGGILRQTLGFRGAVVSDDMEMGALQDLGTPAEVAQRAARAGCDLLIYGRMLRPELDVFQIVEALDALPSERLRDAQARAAAAFRLEPR